MSGRMSRTKGRTAERAVEVMFQDAGYSTDRNIGGRTQVSGDISVASPPLAIEVRRRETLSIPRWMEDHAASCPPHVIPVLTTKQNRKPWLVTMELSDFLDLLGREPASDNTANKEKG